LSYLKAQRRKRIAVLVRGLFPKFEELMDQFAATYRLAIPRHWQQVVPVTVPAAIRNCVRLLMHGPKSQRPDGLLICDDNYAEDAQAALVETGVRVPTDLTVVTHCNFPWPPPNVLPVRRLGYDIRLALKTCIQVLDRQRRGEKVARENLIPAVFEEE